jgi:hypothetical protein
VFIYVYHAQTLNKAFVFVFVSQIRINLMWHDLTFQELIRFLNCGNEDSIIKWSGRSFHVLAAIYLNEFNPYLVVSFIISNFNYCPVTWHFCNEQNTKKMEKIHERALKLIYEDQNSNMSIEF